MSPEAAQLAQYMSDLSEEAYCAGWMQDLEYDLWTAVVRGSRPYGRLQISDEQIAHLGRLSAECSGWIYFDDTTGETWIPLNRWRSKYEERVAGTETVEGPVT